MRQFVKRRPLRKGGRKKTQSRQKLRRTSSVAIRREINRMAETKEKRTAIVSVPISGEPSVVGYQNNFFDPHLIINSIPQGTAIDQRIGNRIRLTKCNFNFMLRPNSDRTVPVVVMVMLLSDKHHPTMANATNYQDAAAGNVGTQAGNILQDGPTSTGFAKRLTDLMVPINTDRYTVYKRKTYKIGRAAPNAGNSNNDFKLLIRGKFNILKYMARIFRYNDNNNAALNRKVWIGMHVVYADGSQLVVPTDVGAYCDYSFDVRWKDI